MSAPVRPTRAAAVKSRVLRVLDVTATGELLVRVTETRGRKAKETEYWLRETASPLGRAFRWEKLAGYATGEDDALYHALLAADGAHQCDCKGFSRWGHCRHLEALAALAAAGRI